MHAQRAIFAAHRPNGPGRNAQHQADVLHGRAGRALAEVVEPRDQHGLGVLLAGEDAQLQHIGAVERLGLEPLVLGSAASPAGTTFTSLAPA